MVMPDEARIAPADAYRDRRTNLVERVARLQEEANSILSEIIGIDFDPAQGRSPIKDETPDKASIEQLRRLAVVVTSNVPKLRNDTNGLRARLEQLGKDVRAELDWEDKDASRRLTENKVAREEVEAFPIRRTPQFIITVGAALFGLGSADVTFSAATAASSGLPFDAGVRVASYLLAYGMGAFLIFLGLISMSSDEARKRITYHALFGGAKYRDTFWGPRPLPRDSESKGS